MKTLKTLSLALTLSGLAVVAIGCAKKKGAPTAAAPLSATVTDVTPATYTPAPAQPQFEPAVPVATATPTAPAPAQVASAGQSYTVRKGDTLFGIARAQYGDGKQWQRIAAANPGVSPSKLWAGQTIVLP